MYKVYNIIYSGKGAYIKDVKMLDFEEVHNMPKDTNVQFQAICGKQTKI